MFCLNLKLIIISIIISLIIRQLTFKIMRRLEFNEKVLRSDKIAISWTDPQLSTELCFEVDTKLLHLCRIERKPLNCNVFYISIL
jgi:hypothetical protein